jgi:hypothetical protein
LALKGFKDLVKAEKKKEAVDLAAGVLKHADKLIQEINAYQTADAALATRKQQLLQKGKATLLEYGTQEVSATNDLIDSATTLFAKHYTPTDLWQVNATLGEAAADNPVASKMMTKLRPQLTTLYEKQLQGDGKTPLTVDQLRSLVEFHVQSPKLNTLLPKAENDPLQLILAKGSDKILTSLAKLSDDITDTQSNNSSCGEGGPGEVLPQDRGKASLQEKMQQFVLGVGGPLDETNPSTTLVSSEPVWQEAATVFAKHYGGTNTNKLLEALNTIPRKNMVGVLVLHAAKDRLAEDHNKDVKGFTSLDTNARTAVLKTWGQRHQIVSGFLVKSNYDRLTPKKATELKQWQTSLHTSHANALMSMLIRPLNFEQQTLVGQQLALGANSEDIAYFNQQLLQFGLNPRGLDATIINMPKRDLPYEIEVTEKGEGKEVKKKMTLPPFSNGLALVHHYGLTGSYSLAERQLNMDEVKAGSQAMPVAGLVGLGGTPFGPLLVTSQLQPGFMDEAEGIWKRKLTAAQWRNLGHNTYAVLLASVDEHQRTEADGMIGQRQMILLQALKYDIYQNSNRMPPKHWAKDFARVLALKKGGEDNQKMLDAKVVFLRKILLSSAPIQYENTLYGEKGPPVRSLFETYRNGLLAYRQLLDMGESDPNSTQLEAKARDTHNAFLQAKLKRVDVDASEKAMKDAAKALKDDQDRIQKIIDSEAFQRKLDEGLIKGVLEFREELKARLIELTPITATYYTERDKQIAARAQMVTTVIRGLGIEEYPSKKAKPASAPK